MSHGSRTVTGCLVALIAISVLSAWAAWSPLGLGAWYYGQMARSKSHGGNTKAAIRYWQRAVQKRPNDTRLRVWLGWAHERNGDDDAALAVYEEAVRRDPESTTALTYQAHLHLSNDDYEKAASVLQLAQDQAPDHPDVRLLQGQLLMAQGQAEEAIPHLEKTVETGTDKPNACYSLAQAYDEFGRNDDALATYRIGARRGEGRCKDHLAAIGEPLPTEEGTPAERRRARRDRAEDETGARTSCESGGAEAGIFAGVFFLLYLAFIGAIMIMWVLAVLCLWDCARRDFPDPNTRAVWSVLLMLTHWIGAIAYYFAVYRHNEPPYLPRNAPPADAPDVG